MHLIKAVPNAVLDVIGVISNPVRYTQRYKLFLEWEDYVLSLPNVRLTVVESAFGKRDFQICDRYPDKVKYVKVRSDTEIWVKESLINVGFQNLSHDWEYAAWWDCDIKFARPDIAYEIIHQHQHYDYLQNFSYAHDLNSSHEVMTTFMGFAYAYWNNLLDNKGGKDPNYTSGNAHVGYAHSCTRRFYDAVGGLLDVAALGSGDRHTIFGLVGWMYKTYPRGIHPDYEKILMAWQDRAMKFKQNFGYVRTSLFHAQHGLKKNRFYQTRAMELVKHNYNPITDLRKNSYGIWELNDNNIGFRDAVRDYFRSRNEDIPEYDTNVVR